MYEVVQRKRWEAAQLRQAGFDLMSRGELEQAIGRHREAAAINEELNDKGALAGDYTNIAIILERLPGKHDEALQLHEKALAVDLEAEFKPGLRIDYGNLMRLKAEAGQIEEAFQFQESLIVVCRALGDLERVAEEYRDRGLMMSHLGRHREAIEAHSKAYTINHDRDAMDSAAGDLTNKAIAHEHLGEHRAALELHREACEIDERIEYDQGLQIDYRNLMRIYYEQGDMQTASTYERKLRDLLRRIGTGERRQVFSLSAVGTRAEISIVREGTNIYTVGYRLPSPIRRRYQELSTRVDAERLDGLAAKLNTVTLTAGRSRMLRSSNAIRPAQEAHQLVAVQLEDLGKTMYALALPQAVKRMYRQFGSADALELGLSDDIVHYPWELMHDGDNFLCLKRSVGRYVITDGPEVPYLVAGHQTTIRALVVGDPSRPEAPHYLEHPSLEPLEGAKREAAGIAELLGQTDGVEVKTLVGDQATLTRVVAELSTGYDLIHFSGHAKFSAESTDDSALILQDGSLSSYEVLQCITTSPKRPVLAFINACESSREGSWKAELSYENEVFGLASAFLRAGVNYIGSVWPIYDEPAVDVATEFYRELLAGKPLGESLRLARKRAFSTYGLGELAWAAYVLYGDPTLTIGRQVLEATQQLD